MGVVASVAAAVAVVAGRRWGSAARWKLIRPSALAYGVGGDRGPGGGGCTERPWPSAAAAASAAASLAAAAAVAAGRAAARIAAAVAAPAAAVGSDPGRGSAVARAVVVAARSQLPLPRPRRSSRFPRPAR